MYHTSTNLNSSCSITTVFYWRTMTTFIFEGAQPSTSDSWIMKSPEIFSLMVIVLGPSFMQIIIVVFNSVAIPCQVKESHWLNNGKSILPISWSMSSSFPMPSWLSMSSRYHYNRENLQLPCLLFHIRGTPSRDILAKPLSRSEKSHLRFYQKTQSSCLETPSLALVLRKDPRIQTPPLWCPRSFHWPSTWAMSILVIVVREGK